MGGVDGHFARPIRPSMPSIRRLLSPGEKLVGRFLDPPEGHHEGSRSWADSFLDSFLARAPKNAFSGT